MPAMSSIYLISQALTGFVVNYLGQHAVELGPLDSFKSVT